jgi:dienelactone hydrolase
MIRSRWYLLALLLCLPVPLAADDQKPSYPKPEGVREDFLDLLDRPKVLFNVKAGEAKEDEDTGLVFERLSFASEKKADGTSERVPVLIVRPLERGKARKHPAVIVLHGTGGSKDNASVRAWLIHLAKRGIIGVAIDARYHGDRAGGAKGAEAYNKAIIAAWRTKDAKKREHPLYYDTCWDLWRTIDYLETRDDIAADRIGMVGISMGGIETWLAAAVDRRVKVAVPAIAVQSFRWSLEHDRWQGRANTFKAVSEAAAKDLGESKVNAKVCKALWDRVLPGITGEFDCPSMIRLFAGRPLLVLSGEKDPNCPLEGAKLAIASAEEAYKAAKAADKLKVMIAKGKGHTLTQEQRKAALEWLEKWLKH